MSRLQIQNFGPIEKADIKFGDLTILVGPQASGKSLLLQLYKLIKDKKHIRRILSQYGYSWSSNPESNIELYFGEGMRELWLNNTKVQIDGGAVAKSNLRKIQRESFSDAKEKVFYIPAQRVVCLANGWPRFFSDYESSVPYVLKHFSETLRRQMEQSDVKKNKSNQLFPIKKKLKEEIRDSIRSAMYSNSAILTDSSGGKKKLLLETGNTRIPFMAWSAGQKEFMPLLLSLYWLSPSSGAGMKEEISTVIIEEPEMGLHPYAIRSVLLQVIDLLKRGYKVIISTHSPVLLEFAWAINQLRGNSKSVKALSELFAVDSNLLNGMFKELVASKTINTYFFNRTKSGVFSRDISSLDVGDVNNEISDWGGISEFSGKVSEIVSKYAEG